MKMQVKDAVSVSGMDILLSTGSPKLAIQLMACERIIIFIPYYSMEYTRQSLNSKSTLFLIISVQ